MRKAGDDLAVDEHAVAIEDDEIDGHEAALKRDDVGINSHRALAPRLGMIFSENRFALFRIMP
jgi:hypothetical protein